jgi:hypothetical protein
MNDGGPITRDSEKNSEERMMQLRENDTIRSDHMSGG